MCTAIRLNVFTTEENVLLFFGRVKCTLYMYYRIKEQEQAYTNVNACVYPRCIHIGGHIVTTFVVTMENNAKENHEIFTSGPKKKERTKTHSRHSFNIFIHFFFIQNCVSALM